MRTEMAENQTKSKTGVETYNDEDTRPHRPVQLPDMPEKARNRDKVNKDSDPKSGEGSSPEEERGTQSESTEQAHH